MREKEVRVKYLKGGDWGKLQGGREITEGREEGKEREREMGGNSGWNGLVGC